MHQCCMKRLFRRILKGSTCEGLLELHLLFSFKFCEVFQGSFLKRTCELLPPNMLSSAFHSVFLALLGDIINLDLKVFSVQLLFLEGGDKWVRTKIPNAQS